MTINLFFFSFACKFLGFAFALYIFFHTFFLLFFEELFFKLSDYSLLVLFVMRSLQSVLPGILQGDKSDSLLYGSVDNGKKICWNEEFHSKVREI